MTKKKWLIGLSAVGILGGAGVYFAPAIEESGIEKDETIKMAKFADMKEVPVEILDTSAFSDENLEKWFLENQTKKGEFIYYDNTHTYILVSAGDKGNDNELIWLDGIRSVSDKLIVGYEFKNGEEYGVKAKEDTIPTLLVRTEGEFKNVKGIVVIKEEPKPVKSEVTEEVVEGDKVEDKEASADDDSKESSKEDKKADEKADVEEKADKKDEKKADEKDVEKEKESKESADDKKE